MRPSRVVALLITVLMILSGTTAVADAAPSDRCSRDTPGQPKNDCTATLLYFNDAHDVRPVATAAGGTKGGIARLDTVIKTARAADPDSAVLFGGDLAGGTLFGGVYHGFPMVDAFNTIGVDLANFGQHDFDFGVDNTRQLMAASKFDWLSSNLVDSNGKPFSGLPWTVRQVGGFTIGYIGITDGMDTTSAGAAVDQLPAAAAAQSAVQAMTAADHPDLIVAITQQPLDANKQLLNAVPQINLALTEEVAEDSSSLDKTADGRWILAPEGNIGSVISVAIRRHGNTTTITPTVLPVDDTVTPDPALKKVEDFYDSDLTARLGAKIATVTTPLLMPDNAARKQEVALGDLVADAFRSAGSFPDGTAADIGWQQGGGLRAEVPGPDFTLESGYSVLPFGDRLMKISATGAQLKQALEQGLAGYDTVGGGFPQVSGMAYSFDPGAPVGSRVQSVTVAGQPLDPAATYTIALTSYVVDGGDGVTAFEGSQVLDDPATGLVDADALNNYVSGLGVVDYTVDGRITVS